MLPEFAPAIKGDHGFGIWGPSGLHRHPVGRWRYSPHLGVNGVQNTVGFARFEQRDVTPPATPQNLKVELRDDGTL